MIHPTAIVDPAARLDAGVKVGAYSVIGPNVTVGANTEIRNHVTLTGWTEIGSDCVIHPCAVLGGEPQDLKYAGERTQVVIGNRNIIREFVTIHAGTALGGGKTVVGDSNLLMAYVHVAHDCRLADHIVIANSVQLGGHVSVEEGARIGGVAAIHHFVTVGRCAFVGGVAKVTTDVPPYTIADGHPAKVRGLNVEGIRRRGLPEDAVAALKEVYLLLFQKEIPRAKALETIAERNLDRFEEAKYMLDSVARSAKGKQGRALEAERIELSPDRRDGEFGFRASSASAGDGTKSDG